MRKSIVLFITVILIFNLSSPMAFATEEAPIELPVIEADSCILIDAASNTVLYEKNADKKQYPASTTKVLTAALTIDHIAPDKKATVSKTAVKSIGIGGSNVGLKAGEVLSIRDLINMALISSANDAANTMAESVSGSISGFVDLMNAKVAQLGLTNTFFSNPVGLDVGDNYPEHMTTARELAQIMRYATTLQAFRETINQSRYLLPVTNLHKESRGYLSSTNRLITDPNLQSDEYTVVGGKTGWTNAARNVFVAVARNADGIELIAVLMKHESRDGIFLEAKALFDYGYKRIAQDKSLARPGFYDVRLRSTEPVIQSFYEKGYITGIEDGLFNYGEQVTYEAFVQVLSRVRGTSSGDDVAACFSSAVSQGLIDEGWYAEREKTITRGEVIQVLDKLLNVRLEDAEIPVFAKLIKDYDKLPQSIRYSVLRVYKSGIIKGNGDGTIQADRELTKEEMVLILNNYLKYKQQNNGMVRVVLEDSDGLWQDQLYHPIGLAA